MCYLDRVAVVPYPSTTIFVYTPAEFAHMAQKPFVRRALSEGVVAYER